MSGCQPPEQHVHDAGGVALTASSPVAPSFPPAGGHGAPRIPFNRTSIVGKELLYIAESLLIGQIAGDQTFTKRCHRLLQQALGTQKALLTTSCTHALEMAAMLLSIEPGDEVIVPSFTFVSTVNAFVLRGATPVFVDVRPDTLNMDEHAVESAITPRTRAVVPVHYGGVACEMDVLLAAARRHGFAVVEDNAHGLFGKYKGRWLGTLGTFATQSFHETKNVTCGEGGALLINDPRYTARAEIIREKGTDRSRYYRGEIDKYTWVDIGSSYVVSDVLAAFLFGQLERWEWIQSRRRQTWERYNHRLADWADTRGVRRPIIPAHCDQAYHLYYLLMPNLEQRQALIAHLRERGILAVFHYQPLHLSVMGQRHGGRVGACPVTEDVSDRLVRLPFFVELTEELQDQVIDAVTSFMP